MISHNNFLSICVINKNPLTFELLKHLLAYFINNTFLINQINKIAFQMPKLEESVKKLEKDNDEVHKIRALKILDTLDK